MAVTIIDAAKIDLSGPSILDGDPFRLAAPCWKIRAMLYLPLEIVNMRPTREQLLQQDIERIKTNMAIRTVEAAKAPVRLFVRGGISSKQDYIDLLAALNSSKNANDAFIVDMDPKAWVDAQGQPIKKPEVTFANSLRRRFEMGGLAITAYMSGSNQVTVRRLTPLEIKEKQAGKGKRKKS